MTSRPPLADRAVAETGAPADRVGTTAGLGLICLTSTTVVWIVWFRRAYRNLPRLAGVELRLGAGWAIGSWLVPILDPAPSP